MASFKKKPEKKFSRVKSDLAELQRWWPAYIKDDGVLGIRWTLFCSERTSGPRT